MFLTRMTSQQVVRQAARPASGRVGGGGGGGVAKYVGGALLATSLGVGGTMAYAGVDDEFRVVVEDSVPGADMVMEMVLGKRTLAEKVMEVPSKLKITTTVLDDRREEKPTLPHPLPQVLPPPPPPVLEVPVLDESVAEEVPTPQVEDPTVVSEVPPQVEPVAATEVATEPVKVGEAGDSFVVSAVDSVFNTATEEDSSVETIGIVTNKDNIIYIEPELEELNDHESNPEVD
jgi:hypothetical protein